MRNAKIRISLAYDSIFATLLKLFLFNGLLILVFYELVTGVFPNLPLFLFSLGLVTHIFIKYELERILPQATISQSPAHPLDSYTKEAEKAT